MLIYSEEFPYDDNGNLLYDNMIILSWKQFGDAAAEDFGKALSSFGLDLIIYNSGGSDFVMRIAKKKVLNAKRVTKILNKKIKSDE